MKKKAGSTIMVALASLDRSVVSLLRKAASLARQRGADVELLHVIALPYGPLLGAGTSVRQAVRASVKDSEAQLRKLAAIPQLRRVNVRASVVWDYPASDAIVRQVLRHRPALLLAESQRHSRLSRMVMTNTDWDLIRNCPCPVLFSKRTQWPGRPNVLAALDPFHSNAKPAALDDAILRHAASLAGTARRVFVGHAYVMPKTPLIRGVTMEMSKAEQTAYDGKVRASVQRVARRHLIPDVNVVTVRDEPIVGLPRLVKKLRADVVAMGAVSRTGLTRLFVGNTAERVVDELDSDVLIVKPRGFVTPVSRRPARLLPFPPYPGV